MRYEAMLFDYSFDIGIRSSFILRHGIVLCYCKSCDVARLQYTVVSEAYCGVFIWWYKRWCRVCVFSSAFSSHFSSFVSCPFWSCVKTKNENSLVMWTLNLQAKKRNEETKKKQRAMVKCVCDVRIAHRPKAIEIRIWMLNCGSFWKRIAVN